jgi:hypothetical protein
MKWRAGLGHRAESFHFKGETRAEPKGHESGGQEPDSPCFLSRWKEATAKIRKQDFDAEHKNVRIRDDWRDPDRAVFRGFDSRSAAHPQLLTPFLAPWLPKRNRAR